MRLYSIYRRFRNTLVYLRACGLYLWRTLLRKPRRILLYPEIPIMPDYVIGYIARVLGCVITSNPDDGFDVILRWEDTTFQNDNPVLDKLAKDRPVINLRCMDISKERVEECFKEVFGYGSFVDPLIHKGVCVQKSNLNAKHDGVILKCPIKEIQTGNIYQRLIDIQYEDALTSEIRLPIFKQTIPVVLIKYKTLQDRFGVSISGEAVQPEECLSEGEIAKIQLFCERLGMDYGELDILRDKLDGRIYIIDANNTPCIHFAGFSEWAKIRILKRLAVAFEKTLF
jgi:hypothetical protein